jgi:transcriptional regulator with XRE-family HTH domain
MGKEYREAFVSSFLKRYIPFQIRTIRKKKEISQQQLAIDSKVTQGVISRAEDPDYGNLTFNTVLRIAAGFDLAFVGKFVRFSDLLKEVNEMSEDSLALPSFLEECKQEQMLNDLALQDADVRSEEPTQGQKRIASAQYAVEDGRQKPDSEYELSGKKPKTATANTASAANWNPDRQDQHRRLSEGAEKAA